MLSDPLFIKTQNELRHLRENKKSSREHIPHSIKDNIKKLNLQYSKANLRSTLDLTSCYNLLAVISLRMEVYQKRRPITFQKSRPWFKS